MKTFMTQQEVERAITDAIPLALNKLPRNQQEDLDSELAEHMLLRGVNKAAESRLRKIEDRLKKTYHEGQKPELTTNYRREITKGEPREIFDLETFITKIMEKYPTVMGHELRTMAVHSKVKTAAPTSFSIEYIGDLARE